MKSGRDGIIRSVLDAYDRMDSLERENEMLKKRLEGFENADLIESEGIGFIDREVLQIGRKTMFGMVTGFMRSVYYDTDKDAVQTFENWRDCLVRASSLPDWMSRRAFYDYFDSELRELYAEECERTLAAHAEEVKSE